MSQASIPASVGGANLAPEGREPRGEERRGTRSEERLGRTPQCLHRQVGVVNATNPLTKGHPPAWASAWGRDEFGTWASLDYDGVEYRLRWIAPGEFMMGAPADEGSKLGDETLHKVRLTRGYWIGETPVTNAFWSSVMQTTPSVHTKDDFPVHRVSWNDVQSFVETLGEDVPDFRGSLPSEAQWEFACRAGTPGARYDEDLDAIAWHYRNSGHQPHPVGEKDPNPWGLFDMLGNVWEWCLDSPEPFRPEPADPVISVEGGDRVLRGGSWDDDASLVRAACRYGYSPELRYWIIGFRLVEVRE